MRVVFFNRSYYPDVGATGQLLAELTQDLVREHGCDVTVVCGPSPDGSRPRLDAHEGVEIVRARGTRLERRGFLGRFTNYVTYFLGAARASLGLRRADVVIALTDPPIIGLAAWLCSRRMNARFVFLCQDVFPEVASLLQDFESPTVNFVLERVNRFLLQRADRVVALGDTMKTRLVEKHADPDKISVIHNWADTDALTPAAKDNPFSRAHGLSGKFVVMHAGNIGLSQNLDSCIDAASRLASNSDIVFVFVGDGVRRPALEEDVSRRGLDNVIFLPYQPRATMRDSYATADVFIVSLKPGLAGYIVPSKLYGILAAGRPYVAAVEPATEVAAITREHDCGAVVAPGDVGGMVHEITRFHRDRERGARLGRNARRAGVRFDRRKQVRAYRDLFHGELVATRSRTHAACEAGS